MSLAAAAAADTLSVEVDTSIVNSIFSNFVEQKTCSHTRIEKITVTDSISAVLSHSYFAQLMNDGTLKVRNDDSGTAALSDSTSHEYARIIIYYLEPGSSRVQYTIETRINDNYLALAEEDSAAEVLRSLHYFASMHQH